MSALQLQASIPWQLPGDDNFPLLPLDLKKLADNQIKLAAQLPIGRLMRTDAGIKPRAGLPVFFGFVVNPFFQLKKEPSLITGILGFELPLLALLGFEKTGHLAVQLPAVFRCLLPHCLGLLTPFRQLSVYFPLSRQVRLIMGAKSPHGVKAALRVICEPLLQLGKLPLFLALELFQGAFPLFGGFCRRQSRGAGELG